MATNTLNSPEMMAPPLLEAVIISGDRRGEIVQISETQTLPSVSAEEESLWEQFYALIGSIENTAREISGRFDRLNEKMDNINRRLSEPV